MHKPLTLEEKASLNDIQMSKREKLVRLATLVRNHPRQVVMYHNLEYTPPDRLLSLKHEHSVFMIAAQDPVLQSAGLTAGDAYNGPKFFAMTSEEAHYISCDCGGQLTNGEMAYRLERLAERA
jgi:hypothetical protein